MSVLGYLVKLKRGMGLTFGAHFLHDFYINYIIKLLFRQMMTSKTLRFFLNQPLNELLTGKKRGEDENTEIWISPEQTELFRWNKKHFP